MIASRQHGFVFIKTMKTGSTSIELALSPHCGSDDILTPIGARFDLQRFRDCRIVPRHFADADRERRYCRALEKGSLKLLKRVLSEIGQDGLWAHALPDAIIAAAPDLWDRAFRFASERHPYEKAISRAHFGYKPESGSFADHLQRIVFSDRKYVGHPYYMQGGKLLVHEFIRHETLQGDYDGIVGRLGIVPGTLPRARRVDYAREPAGDVLTTSQKDFIYEQCAPEFELFGWRR